ncbi:protein-disulfide reductase DsbD [Oceanobacter kriegii]|uniref:protein-disulfide reductase DsbD n=1 Tax=Oceanobacter kriegii TaxID=64972 RepID=UPI0004146F2A|nr:protein-disulfide reductase DsbD [Oceanobacter kriegii]
MRQRTLETVSAHAFWPLNASPTINRVLATLATLLCLLLVSQAHAGLFDQEPEFLPVDQAFPLDTQTDGGLLVANWNTAPEHYLYQHRIFLQQDGQKYLPSYFSLEGKPKFDEAFGDIIAYYGPLEVLFPLDQLKAGPATLNYQGCADAGLCYPPQKVVIDLQPADIEAAKSNAAAKASAAEAQANQTTSNTSNQSSISNNATQNTTASSPRNSWFEGSAWTTIGLFFLLGIGLTFTPCVLPMIPIMTSVVMGQNQQISARRGFVLSTTYVLGMAITYAAAGVVMGLLGAGANIQAWMQTPWVLMLFAALFVLLSLAMFGVYELQLPSALRNRLNSASQKQSGGHIASVFLIGVLSALVVSPCVSAPLAGALVYLSTTGDVLLGGAALLALGLGMGVPLIILGTTGGSVLPKAGGWMEQIKVFFGILLLGVAIWLLSRILPGPIVLLLWGVLALVYGVVLGALEPASGKQRVIKGVALLLLVYGIAATWGALQGNHDPLKPLGNTISYTGSNTAFESNTNTSRNSGQSLFFKTDSVEEVKRLIDNSQQPVMLDLYADWCISCKVMEDEIFSQPDVQQRLSHVRWVQLDVTDNTDEQIAFLQSVAVFGPPTILFYENGTELASLRLAGEADKAEFLQHISPLSQP